MKNTVLTALYLLCCTLVGCARTIMPDHQPLLPNDYSKAGTDGPHVFYKGGKIVAKSVILEDSVPVARKAVFRKKSDALLTCRIPETGDAFSFGLMDSIDLAPAVHPATKGRILVLSDIEGNFLALKTMLLGAKVINDKFEWTFGKSHLVLVGDFFDRGIHVTECLWLIYKLEMEAKAVGGTVHFILGNHEVMNLAGDTRYVRNKYFENAELIGEDYEEWYKPDTELGLWLRSKNAMEQIGDVLYCHGGLSPSVTNSRLDLETVNRIARRWYGKPAKQIKDPDASLIFDDKTGVFWYRDMARNIADKGDVAGALAKFGVERIVIGHTLVNDVMAYYRGKVVCIDLLHEENIRMGFMKTLYIENGLFYGLDSRGEKTSVVSY
jgi:hypothetical protein